MGLEAGEGAGVADKNGTLVAGEKPNGESQGREADI